jgi:prophage antirepressor-like protein
LAQSLPRYGGVFVAVFEEVRVLIHSADTVWFMAKDIFEFLDLAWRGADSLWQRQIPKEWAILEDSQTLGGVQKTWFINERAIYKLAFRSNKPEAETFTNWVAEVIETIRKTGKYELQPKSKVEVLLEMVQILVEHEKQIKEHQKRLDEHETRLTKVEAQIQTTNKDYYSLAGYYALNKKQWSFDKTEVQKTGSFLKKLSTQLGFSVIKVYDANYGEVNGYHKDVLAKGLGF